MQGTAWIELIKRIPPAQHDNLVAVTATGLEIMVQRIMRLENEFVIFRGRPVGSADQPRVLLLPWDQLNHLAFQKALPEQEVHRIFGNGEPMPAEAATDTPQEPVAESEPPAADAESATPASAPAATPSATKKPAPLSKSVLLARLRARMASDASKS